MFLDKRYNFKLAARLLNIQGLNYEQGKFYTNNYYNELYSTLAMISSETERDDILGLVEDDCVTFNNLLQCLEVSHSDGLSYPQRKVLAFFGKMPTIFYVLATISLLIPIIKLCLIVRNINKYDVDVYGGKLYHFAIADAISNFLVSLIRLCKPNFEYRISKHFPFYYNLKLITCLIWRIFTSLMLIYYDENKLYDIIGLEFMRCILFDLSIAYLYYKYYPDINKFVNYESILEKVNDGFNLFERDETDIEDGEDKLKVE